MWINGIIKYIYDARLETTEYLREVSEIIKIKKVNKNIILLLFS